MSAQRRAAPSWSEPVSLKLYLPFIVKTGYLDKPNLGSEGRQTLLVLQVNGTSSDGTALVT
jgi:hypothetical protein